MQIFALGDVDGGTEEEALFTNPEAAEKGALAQINDDRREDDLAELELSGVEWRDESRDEYTPPFSKMRFAYTADGDQKGYLYVREVQVFDTVEEFWDANVAYNQAVGKAMFEEGEYQV